MHQSSVSSCSVVFGFEKPHRRRVGWVKAPKALARLSISFSSALKILFSQFCVLDNF